MPAAITCVTALPAASTLEKLAITTCAQAGLGISLTVTSVTTPNMPSDPMKTDSRSRPGASGASEPSSTTSPSIVTTRTRSTLCTVKPYFRQCTPPEFSATLPTMEQAIWLEGSGA
ncbi:hypothetical protein G6F57_022894 [Rhizopus arrhizus]|nr:hypothetical protein G6F57_022894 [Rhizopus arrhizus]